MNLRNAAVLLEWVRREIGGDIRLWPHETREGVYLLSLEATQTMLPSRVARRRIDAAIHRHGEELVQLLLDEREQYPAGAELLLWSEARPA